MNKSAKVATIFALVLAISLAAFFVFAAPKKCNNGTDDDNDGLVDYPNDPGCSSASDNTETGTAVCDNGADATNDRDTLADYRLSGGDPGCTSPTDSSEIDGMCDDNIDDASDQDTLSDASDPGCTSTSDSSEIDGQCDDKSDNDGDGNIDYGANRDSKCSSFSDNNESPKDSCSDTDGGQNAGLQGTVSGDDENVPFSNTDFCIDATHLNEYYCGSYSLDYAPLNTTINCVSNSTTSCSAGRCVPS